jgi:AcrR family transcriptional regulator
MSTKRALTRDRVVRAGMAIAARDGLAGLSMRKVAAKLGCEVMSLYNHVRSKDDLLADMLDEVYGEFDQSPPDTSWRPALRQMALSGRDALRRHEWATELTTSFPPGPNRRRHMEAMLAALAEADLPEDVADLGFHALTVHIQGYTHQQVGFETRSNERKSAAEQFAESLDADDYPHLSAHIQYHRERGHHHDDFAFVLDLILDGLERAGGQ